MPVRFLDEEAPASSTQVRFTEPATPVSQQNLRQQVQTQQMGIEQQENPISTALFPRTKQAKLSGVGSEQVATGLDLLSLPGRALSSLLGRDKDEGFLESMASLEEGGFVWNITRDPATGAMLLTLPAGGAGGAMAKSLPKLKQLSALTGIGIAEGVLGAGTTQAEQMNVGGEFSPGQFTKEVAISGSVPLGLQLTRGLIRGGNKLFGKIAEEATGVPEKALRVAGTKEGRKQLKRFAGKELALGEEMLDILDNFDQHIPEKQVVNEALEGMKPMSLADLRVFIERQKIKPIKGLKLSETQKAVNNELTSLADRIKVPKKGQAVSEPLRMTAKDYKTFRTQIDDGVEFDKVGGRAFSELNNKMFKIRTFMKNSLIDEARASDPQGLKGYESAMEAWSQKLDIKESLDDVLGGKQVTRKQKAANLMGNIFSKSNKVKLGLVKKLDQITNNNFIEKAGLAELSERLGPTGAPSLLPAQRTGAALKGVAAGGALGPVGGAAGAGISSPALATKGLRLFDLMESGAIDSKVSTLGGLIGREAVGE